MLPSDLFQSPVSWLRFDGCNDIIRDFPLLAAFECLLALWPLSYLLNALLRLYS